VNGADCLYIEVEFADSVASLEAIMSKHVDSRRITVPEIRARKGRKRSSV